MATNMTPQGILPMHIQQVATAQQLGLFTKVYKNSPLFVVGRITGAILCILFACFFITIITVDGTDADRGSLILFLIIDLFFLGMAGFMIYTVTQIVGRRIYLFQQGLIIEHRGQMQVIPWSQVTEVWQSITRRYVNGIYTGTTYKYRLSRVDGYQIKLDNFTKNIAELGEAITSSTARELVPRALYSIRAGQTLTFGKFSMNTYGISNGQESIPWQQVQDLRMNRGFITIKKAGKFFNWASARVAKIPNSLVFLAVMREMQKQAGGNQAQY